MEDWTVYPAIDLRQGRVVRLVQGDPGRETEYADDPLGVARRWQDAGASWVHVVNLDGAFGERSKRNLDALERIVTTGLSVQFGGGLRDLVSIRQALGAGVERVVVGTAAVQRPTVIEAALEAFGAQRVALAIDARAGEVRTHGWQAATELTPMALASAWADRGIRWVVFTDVARDGTGRGLNLGMTVDVARASDLRVIASGGVASLEDVRRTHQAGLSGIVIGRALYEGKIDLRDALQVGGGPDVG
ncbi:MAG: 1-(5-phosphoribosyl)-5-[(5-phosphoribosylamino)methylideneamino]imidazole-4-carboxamide isomerase [Armatimonadota bacterium]|nr:1-(5-phosphoribosyl)-5-[(5-phosphoribosylamino)methylideneamino]imidazole-4-carboxamide isomerase [Armatimonadota bacterium]